MRKSDLLSNHKSFDKDLSRYRAFMGKVINAQRVVGGQMEKRDIAESIVLRLCAHWERFVDEHLIDCINVDHSRLSEFLGVAIPRNPNKNLCEAVLFGDRYRDFSSFGQLKGFTKKILPEESNPFLAVTPARGTTLDELYKIRNYLAHYSSNAKRSLKRMYTSKYQMAKFQEPGQFLLAYEGRRLWGYFDCLEGISQEMKSWHDQE